MINGRRQPSCDGTSRMMREYQVRICERLGVKFPGPTPQNENSPILGLCQLLPPAPDIGLPMLPPPCAMRRPEQVQHKRARQGARQSLNGRYGIFGRGRADHSALMPANLTTLAHFSVSAAMNFPSSSGAIGISTTPTSASRDFAFASASTALISLLSLSMISTGVFFGAPTPNHPLAS